MEQATTNQVAALPALSCERCGERDTPGNPITIWEVSAGGQKWVPRFGEYEDREQAFFDCTCCVRCAARTDHTRWLLEQALALEAKMTRCAECGLVIDDETGRCINLGDPSFHPIDEARA